MNAVVEVEDDDDLIEPMVIWLWAGAGLEFRCAASGEGPVLSVSAIIGRSENDHHVPIADAYAYAADEVDIHDDVAAQPVLVIAQAALFPLPPSAMHQIRGWLARALPNLPGAVH